MQKKLNAPSAKEDRAALTASIIRDLYAAWEPHPAQATILYDIFYNNIKNVFAECGRKFGKTEIGVDFLRRIAMLNPNAGCYYIANEQKQAKEILWATKRIHRMIPKHYIKGINNTEMRITLINDSFIKLDGSDNAEAGRGWEPHGIVYDEIKDHDPNFHVAMNPNRAVYDAPLLVIGTPPEFEGFATELKADFMSAPNSRYHNYTSFENPHVSKDWLLAEKKRLFERGEEDVWYREYEAKFVRGGKNAIFPMLNEQRHKIKHDIIRLEISRDLHKLKYFVVADPGNTTIFAVLFCAYNPYRKKWYLLDEIYESDQRETSVSKILPRIKEKMEELNPLADWTHIYDEAAAWFFTEATQGIRRDIPVFSWCQTNKHASKRDPLSKEPWGISLIKDILLFDKVAISDRCVNMWHEASNYTRSKTRRGDIKIMKGGDHLIDCWRYVLEFVGFSLEDIREPNRVIDDIRRKVYTIDDDVRGDLWMLPWDKPTRR